LNATKRENDMELKAKAKFTNVLKAKAVFERVNVVSGDITATNTALDAVNEEVIGTTPAEKIDYVDAWKADIKAAIEDKGVDMTGVIPVEYADKIAEISGSATGDAVASEVLAGKTFSNETATGLTGTMPNRGAVSITPGTSAQTIEAGYHNGAGAVAGDADLVTGNIRAGATIFGVAGKTEVVDTSSGDAVAGDLLNDKKVWVDGAEITGTRPPCPVPWTGVAGDSGVAWPDPRFVDNGDNTITDMLTGLMWLKNSNPNGNATWANQITYCADLTTGGHTDWRMPNIKEFVTLLDYSPVSTKLPAGHPFTNASTQVFHLDAEMPHSTTNSMTATLQYGSLSGEAKTQSRAVWPVRGPIAL
jgi:hypothetical protein